MMAAGAAIGLAILIMNPASARAARVSGILTGYETSTPEPSRDLHFQNAISGDIYLSPTHNDGSFAVELPPGRYDLRAERGVVLRSGIGVGEADVALGNVSEAAPYAPARLFQLQDVADSILTSPAPSTAYIMTVDTTMLRAGAAYPAPKIDWSKLPAEVQAAPMPVMPPQAAGSPAPAEPPAEAEGAGNGPVMTEPPLKPSKGADPATSTP